jgi:hypothetical protein
MGELGFVKRRVPHRSGNLKVNRNRAPQQTLGDRRPELPSDVQLELTLHLENHSLYSPHIQPQVSLQCKLSWSP